MYEDKKIGFVIGWDLADLNQINGLEQLNSSLVYNTRFKFQSFDRFDKHSFRQEISFL